MDKKWAEVSLSGEFSFPFLHPGKTESMVTAFPSKPKGVERMATNTKEEEEKYYTKTHHLALRLCSSFPNNAPQQLVPKITEHANSEDGKGGKRSEREKVVGKVSRMKSAFQ